MPELRHSWKAAAVAVVSLGMQLVEVSTSQLKYVISDQLFFFQNKIFPIKKKGLKRKLRFFNHHMGLVGQSSPC